MTRWFVTIATSVMWIFLAAPTHCCGAADAVVVETLLTGLNNPCGVAVRPGESAADRYEVLVADSGAGRILRIWSNEPDAATEVISGFALATVGPDRKAVGPIGLLFLDRTHLIVGASGSDSGGVQMFELTEQLDPITTDLAKQQVHFSPNGRGHNHVFSIARTRANNTVPDSLVLACVSNDGGGDLRKIAVRAGTLAEFQPFGMPHDDSEKDVPAAVAVGEGGYVLVAWVGRPDVAADSRLKFYNPIAGARALELSTDLYDAVGLAYSPKSGNLYAADVAWMEPEKGGVFRIDDASEPGAARCKTVRIADVEQPSAMAFGPDGALYVTAFGGAGESAPQGVLLRITGDL